MMESITLARSHHIHKVPVIEPFTILDPQKPCQKPAKIFNPISHLQTCHDTKESRECSRMDSDVCGRPMPIGRERPYEGQIWEPMLYHSYSLKDRFLGLVTTPAVSLSWRRSSGVRLDVSLLRVHMGCRALRLIYKRNTKYPI